MTDWTDFGGDLENSVLISVEALQQIVNNTSNIYERIMVLESLKGGITPVGAIMLWKGSAASIPQGFQLADGTNGTPDLRDKFVRGIASGETDDNLLDTGGNTQHVHTMGTISTTGSHSHIVFMDSSYALVNAQSGGATQVAMSGHSHAWTAKTGDSGDHTHTGTYAAATCLPPYKKYYWIVRIPA